MSLYPEDLPKHGYKCDHFGCVVKCPKCNTNFCKDCDEVRNS